MAEILLSTCNARYAHASFGLRYLLANMGDLASRTAILEFDIARSTLEVAEAILARKPRILGLGGPSQTDRPEAHHPSRRPRG